MTFTFYPDLPVDVGKKAVVISGATSSHFDRTEYLIIRDKKETKAFEIRYEYHCSPFKEAVIINELLLVGHEAHFYLYDLKTQQNQLALEMNGYFGHFYTHGDYFYVADAHGLYCINQKGEVVWRNESLGIDGVIVQKFTDNHIFGSGEWNPPGGWQNFILKLSTGQEVNGDIR